MTAVLPLVSILIPSYKPRHFEIALASALAQAYPHKEIIVSDDCPTEDIAAICARYPGVSYSRNPNPGSQNNLLHLVDLAKGELIKYLFDDDILHPLCLSQMVDGFLKARSATLAFSPRDLIDADSRIVQRPRAINVKEPLTLIPGAQLMHRCITDAVNHVGEFSTVMFRKRDILGGDGRAGFFSYHGKTLRGLGDIATWLQLCERGDVLYFSDVLSYFRIHPDSNTSAIQSADYRAGVTEWIVFAEFACSDPRFTREDRLHGLDRIRQRLLRKMPAIPDLANELRQVEAMIQAVTQAA
jgi:glycosyltransferase involved in cell wall biosynthesis